jgi:hypothetical protein
MLPRLPLVENVKDFWAFSKAGRKLAELHLNYETVAPSTDVTLLGDDGKTYSVDKMRFPKKDQKETINYNSKITVSNIPAKAYEYVVNGKSAIEWIMEPNAFGSTFAFFADTQINAKKCKRATKPTHQRHLKQWTTEQRQTERQHLTAVWQKWRFSTPQTHLWLIKVWFSASTFVVKIATFAKPQTVMSATKYSCGTL